jgi:NADP-dependent 3-hydroxy acid dehydrogenase YdfG
MKKRAIIVGASSGIGRGLAKVLVENNYLVGITGRRTELLEEIKKENPDNYIISVFDVRDYVKIPAYLTQLKLQLGGLDLLIFNSGIGERMTQLDFDKDKKILDTNVLGFTSVVDWTFEFFNRQGYGHLAATTSVAGIRGGRWAPSYSASKAYQMNYLEGLRQRAGKLKIKIHITDIRPGFVNTVMAQGDDIFWVSPIEKASRQIYKAILDRRKIVYITKRWRLVAMIIRRIPSWIYDKI